jgi:FkbM family methyltransferase
MNLSGISDKSFLGKALRFPLSFIPKKLVIPIIQGKLRGYKWIVGASNHGCWLGSYEFEMQKLFQRTITRGSVVFDLGAQAGFYTLLASGLVGSEGKVFAFEPLPRNLFYLKEHIRLNKITNTTVIEAAVCDRSGTAYFKQVNSRLMGYLSETGWLQVNTVTLDDLVSQGKIPLPDFLKIDVEGAETAVLQGAKAILAQKHPVIFLSSHGDIVHKQCCDILGFLNYSLNSIDGFKLQYSTEILALPRMI